VILVDTSVWIDWLRAAATPAAALLERLLDEDMLALSAVTLQELLQGARNEGALGELDAHFSALTVLVPTLDTYRAAGALYARCRWQGITPRSPHDCLIAQTAIEHDVPLLCDDRDFQALARVAGKLRLLSVK